MHEKKIKYVIEIQDLPPSILVVGSVVGSVVVVGSHFGSKDITSAVQLQVSRTQPSLGIHYNKNEVFILRFTKKVVCIIPYVLFCPNGPC